jgi:hypothetical protein
MRLLLLCLCTLSFAVSYAQPAKRVIGLSEKEWNGTGWDYSDTANYQYNGSRGNNFLSPEVPFFVAGWDASNYYIMIADTIAAGEKTLLTYNANDSITGETTLNLVAGVWVNDRRRTRVYNVDKLLLLEIYENWNTATNVWDSASRYLYTYDNSNRRVSITTYTYTAGNWQGYSQFTNVYDAAGNVLTFTSQNWANGNWANYYRDVSTYDANNNRLTFLREYSTSGTWAPDTRSTFTYNGSNKLLTQISQYYQSGVWINSEQHTYVRDNNGNATLFTIEKWDNNGWKNHMRYTYTYNSANKIVSTQTEGGNGSGWALTGRFLYAYDNSNKRTAVRADTWTGSAWLLDYRYEYPYDADGYWLGELTYRLANGNEQLQQETLMFYEAYIPNNVNEAREISNSVYPNPATQNALLTFEAEQSGNVLWAVLDLNGRQLESGSQYCTAGQQSILLNLNNYADGIYLYTLSTEQGNKGQGKIVKY